MGTRADFYVGKGKEAEWIGSIAWDGYRDGICPQILQCQNPEAFRHAVEAFLKDRDDATWPKDGWPWPWDDSGTSDCSYWHFDGKTWEAGRGDVYVPCDEKEPESEEAEERWLEGREKIDYPNMKSIKNVQWGAKSGVMIFAAPKDY